MQLTNKMHLTLEQTHDIGVKSVGVLCFCLSLVGILLTVEFSYHLKLVLQQDSLVPAFSSLLVIRELGPVVTSLLLLSKVGASMTAQLALMKSTDQIDALRMAGISPFKFLVLPRVIAFFIANFCITIFGMGVALAASVLTAPLSVGASMPSYFQHMLHMTEINDLRGSVFKAIVFGILLPIVCCGEGLTASSGAKGVGIAATQAVIRGTLVVILFDFFLTYVLFNI